MSQVCDEYFQVRQVRHISGFEYIAEDYDGRCERGVKEGPGADVLADMNLAPIVRSGSRAHELTS